jgi:hypothetical protein
MAGIDGSGELDKFQRLGEDLDAAGATFETVIAAAHGVFDELAERRHGGIGSVGLDHGGHEFHLRSEALALATYNLERRFVHAKAREFFGAKPGERRRRPLPGHRRRPCPAPISGT